LISCRKEAKNMDASELKKRRRKVQLITFLFIKGWLDLGLQHSFGIVINNNELPEMEDLRVIGSMTIEGDGSITFAHRVPKMSPRQSAEWVTLVQVAKGILTRGYISSRDSKTTESMLFTGPLK
jgi:hypothetical protein